MAQPPLEPTRPDSSLPRAVVEQHPGEAQLRIRSPKLVEASRIQVAYPTLSPVTTRVLAARGLRVGADLLRLYQPDLTQLPSPDQLSNLKSVVESLSANIKEGRPIGIIAPTSPSGVIATCTLLKLLSEMGVAAEYCLIPCNASVKDVTSDLSALSSEIFSDGLLITLDPKAVFDTRPSGVREVIGISVDHGLEQDVGFPVCRPSDTFCEQFLKEAGPAIVVAYIAKQLCKDLGQTFHSENFLTLAALDITVSGSMPTTRSLAFTAAKQFNQTDQPALGALRDTLQIDRIASPLDIECTGKEFVRIALAATPPEKLIEFLICSNRREANILLSTILDSMRIIGSPFLFESAPAIQRTRELGNPIVIADTVAQLSEIDGNVERQLRWLIERAEGFCDPRLGFDQLEITELDKQKNPPRIKLSDGNQYIEGNLNPSIDCSEIGKGDKVKVIGRIYRATYPRKQVEIVIDAARVLSKAAPLIVPDPDQQSRVEVKNLNVDGCEVVLLTTPEEFARGAAEIRSLKTLSH
ncbi:MAG: hypothetical protein KDD53_09525, partial [Bdellovibrionales bacterium]|nr:hypothetical protein [Bdellovibrionales bacterium]